MSDDAPVPDRRPFWSELRFWAAGFAAGMLILSLQRVLLFALHAPDADHGGTLRAASPAFWQGLRFDAAALAYPFVLVLLIGALATLIRRGRPQRRIERAGLIGALAFISLLAMAELFFFQEFRTRLNFVALEYLDDPSATVPLLFEFAGLGGTLLGFGGLALTIFCIVVFVRRAFVWAHGKRDAALRGRDAPSWGARALLLLLLFVASRGGLGRPLRPQDAHPSPHRFVNQLTLAGPFTLGRHVYELLKDSGGSPDYGVAPSEALATARSVFSLPGEQFIDDRYPALRSPRIDGPPRRLNVVFVVLESFAARFVGQLRGDPENSLTPELDALIAEGVLFTRFLATGPSTNRSLASLIAGVPCLVKRTALPKSAAGQRELITIGSVLRDQGYTTAFLQSGGNSWENLGGWLRSQGFERLLDGSDLDPGTSVSSAGPPDHVLFDRALRECDDMAADGLFLATILTSTNHPPFALPDPLPPDVQARVAAVPDGPHVRRHRAVLYADWAFGQFVRQARATDWGRRTLFVAVGDHGVHRAPVADIDPDRRHVPLLLLGPIVELTPRRVEQMGSHVDVLPTLLSLLQVRARHAAWGRDLLDLDPSPRFAVLGPHGGLNAFAVVAENGDYLVDHLDGATQLFQLDFESGLLAPRVGAPDRVAELQRLGRSYLSSAHHALDRGYAGPLPEED